MRSTRIVCTTSALFAIWLAMISHDVAFADVLTGEKLGQELFLYEWSQQDDRSPGGDGLGPLYNARSCVTCHQKGGIGGTSEIEHNLIVITQLDPPRVDFESSLQALNRARSVQQRMAGLFDRGAFSRSTILHRFGIGIEYPQWRSEWLHGLRNKPERGSSLPKTANLRFGKREGQRYFVSERNSPALFGAGQINRVPAEALRELAASQASDNDGIAGEVSEVGGDVGRFGWRGQIASLHDFVGSACANELGLEVTGHSQAEDPLEDDQSPHSRDLEPTEVEALTAFVASLPAPSSPASPSAEEKQGYALFRQIGCATCHVEQVADIEAIYSDLLLHDMGPQFMDAPNGNPLSKMLGNAPGIPSMQSVHSFPITPADYLGAIGGTELSSKWRTPPLWGVADTAPYLHDGRAESVEQAIVAHGGEAQPTKSRFQRLSPAKKQAVIEFLNGLRTPAAVE